MPYLILTTLIWAFSFGLIGNELEGLDPLLIGSARLLIALIIFLPFLRGSKVTKSNQLKLTGIGAVQFGIMYICYLSAFRFIPSHLVALFSVLTPVYVVLIHDLFHRELNTRYLFAAILSVTGASVIKAKSGPSGSIWLGFALMQISGISFAFGQVIYREWKRERQTVKDHQVFGYLYAGGALVALLASFIISPAPSDFLEATWKQWCLILYLGAVASGLGFFLWNKGAVRSSAGALAACNNAVVPAAIIVSLFVFREIDGASASDIIRLVLGAALITSAVFIGKAD